MKIDQIRKQIDALDAKVLEALNNRASLAKKIGAIKNKNSQVSYVPHREKQIITGLVARNKGPLTPLAIETIYREILNTCRSLESKIRIAYFGPEATFTHQAALKNFGGGAQYLPAKTITDVFVEVEKGRADFGVVPIENSTEGMVSHTHDMFIESDLVICSEISMQIEECLLSKTGNKKDIKTVVSFYQPLAQCRNWLEENLPGVQIKEMASTADAARYAAQNKNAAAIASSAAAGIYGLEIVERGIEDSKENYTRFLVIGKTPAQRSGHDKTSILFSLKDRVGALHDVLTLFKKHKINMTRIESRPTKKKVWQYVFFVDFLGHLSDTNIKGLLKKLNDSCPLVKVLGSYPKAD